VALSQIGKSGKDREMARYLVHGIVKIDVQSEIEADSEAEAMLIASQMSGADFDEDGLGRYSGYHYWQAFT